MSMQPIIPPLKPRVHRSVAERAAWKAQEQASAVRLGATVAHAMQTAADPALDTAIGRLRFDGVITPSQFAAAEAYGLLRGLFDHEMGITRRSARSPCYGAASGGGSTSKPMSERALAALKSDHVRLIATTRSAYPILDRVVLDDQDPEPREVERLRNALDRLVAFFRIRTA